jgi:Tol biopolymer transport system component/tRNA A-37 threonylcarbamoyl transferase component Bud32
MAPERWLQVKEIFAAAQARPGAERARFVDEACAGDEEMRREVESLLSSYNSAASFMERPAVGEVADAIVSEPVQLSGGQRLSHYEIISPLGAGGMGEVFLATDTRLKRKAALKILPQEFTADKVRLRRFEQEAQTASGLNHPNIITIYEVGTQGDVNFIATEFVAGQTLREKLRGGPLPVNETLEIAQQVAGALMAAHEAGIVHRDIKPENIMVRPDGLVKVLDFGLAKSVASVSGAVDTEAETLARGMTTPGVILGTLHYMSPEQVRGQPLDARSDIFSLGAVMYEMLTGGGPFIKSTRGDVIAAILTETPPLNDIPLQLQGVVAKALQKDTEKRYQTSQDLLLDLKNISRELALNTHTGRVAQPTNETAAHATGTLTARRFSLLHALAVLLLAGLALGALWWLAFRRSALDPASLKTAEVVTWRSAPGEIYSIGAFSPDGARVAFVTNASGSANIYVKQTNANAPPVQTTKDESRNEQPVWSPDGEEIAFFSTRGGQPGLWRVPYLGGAPTLIKTVGGGNTRARYWAESGTLYYEERQNLFAVDIKSGQTTQLTNFETANPRYLSISPDEKQIVYVTSEGERWGVWVMPARGGAARQIVNSAVEIRNTIWHPDSQRILYSALADGVFQLFVTDADGSPPVQITFGDRDSLAQGVSKDGAKILYGSSKEESDIWGVNLAKGEEFALTSDINSELWPGVAPDSKSLVFLSVRNLSQGDKIHRSAIMSKPTDSDTPPAQLAAEGIATAWSPDGKQVAFMRYRNNNYNLWVVKALGGEERQLTKQGVFSSSYTVLPYSRLQTSDYSWSPDSSRIAYGSRRSGVQNLWLVTADGAGDTQLTDNREASASFYCPLWSSDGKVIAYTSKMDKTADGKPLYGVLVIDVEAKTAKPLFQSGNYLRLLGWSPDGKGLIVSTSKHSAAPLPEVNVLEISVASGEQRTLSSLPSAYPFNIHLSADGQMIAYVAQADGKDNLWLRPVRGGAAKKLTTNNDARLYFSSLAWSPDGKAIYFGKQSRYSLLSMITNFK